MFSGSVLHVGCGGAALPDWLDSAAETRLDIDEAHSPDIVASMTDIGDIGPFDVVYSSHSLEHLTPHDAAKALAGFYRVLRDGGAAIVIVPNLDGIKPDLSVVYTTAEGLKVTGRDMHYGHADLVDQMPYMAHKSGFVPDTLQAALDGAGFKAVKIAADDGWNLIGVGVK